jgi:hypothetical protein
MDGAEFALHCPVVVINTIGVNVSDVYDDAVVDGVTRTVHATFSHLLGNWHVRITASAKPGLWDLHLQGAFGHHVTHFLAAEPGHLTDAVERRLRAFLRGVVPPLSARSWSTFDDREHGSPVDQMGEHLIGDYSDRKASIGSRKAAFLAG